MALRLLYISRTLFMKSTEPTNIFKLGVKKTGQSAPTIHKVNNNKTNNKEEADSALFKL